MPSKHSFFKLSSLAVVVALAFAGPMAVQAQAVADGAKAASLSIAAQPLDAALNALSAATGTPIGFSPSLVAGKTAQAVKGNLSVRQAVDQLLAGSGLIAVQEGNGFVVKAVSTSGDAATLAPVTVTGRAELDATTEGGNSYAAKGSTLFKGAQSLKDIPQSVTVMTRQRMDDQGLDTVEEVLANTPGITLYKRPGGGSDFYSRGFQATNVQYDGVPLFRSAAWGNTYTSSSVYLDRIEVLRGAQGLLEGAGNPGGAINLVRKRGLAERTLKIDGRIGSWDNYGTRLEAGGSLDKEGRVRSRVVLDYEDKHSFIDTIHDRNLIAYAALDFDLTPDTTLGVGVSQSDLKGGSLVGNGVLRYADGSPLDIPRSTYMGAGWNDAKRRETQVFLDLEHRFNADWKFKFSSAYVDEEYDSTQSTANGDVPRDGGTVGSYGYIYGYGTKAMGFDAVLSGRFTALGIAHDVVLGGNYSKQKKDDRYTQYKDHVRYDPFNIDHDVPRLGTTAPTQFVEAYGDMIQKGLYGMLRSHLTDDLTLVLGGRVSWYRFGGPPYPARLRRLIRTCGKIPYSRPMLV